MIPSEDPAVGDLVTIIPQLGEDMPMFAWWGSKTLGYPTICDKMLRDELAIVIEDLHVRGGNGVRILTSTGKIGWVNVCFLTRL